MFETAYWHERVKLHCDCEVEMSDIDAYYDTENRKVKADKSLSGEEKERLMWENNEMRGYEKQCCREKCELSLESLRLSYLLTEKEIAHTHPTTEGFLWNTLQYKEMSVWRH